MRPNEFRKMAWVVVLILILGNIGLWTRVRGVNELQVSFLNVGQGDSTYIKTPNGIDVLIDGGPSSIVLSELGKIMLPFDKEIDLVIISHPDKDHIGGLPSVFEAFNVKTVLQTDVSSDSLIFNELREAIATEKSSITIAKRGLALILDEKENIYLEVLHPDKQYKDSNQSSIVSRLVYGNTEFMFTGDADELVEKNLVLSGLSLDSEVLKVGHHGSKSSSSEPFLNFVNPRIAIISVGDNSYGHPNNEVIESLKSLGAEVLRTDIGKTIRFLSDGFSVRVI